MSAAASGIDEGALPDSVAQQPATAGQLSSTPSTPCALESASLFSSLVRCPDAANEWETPTDDADRQLFSSLIRQGAEPMCPVCQCPPPVCLGPCSDGHTARVYTSQENHDARNMHEADARPVVTAITLENGDRYSGSVLDGQVF